MKWWSKLLGKRVDRSIGVNHSFYVCTKMADSITKKVVYKRYVVSTGSSVFPYHEFEKMDSSAIISCFEVDENSYNLFNNAQKLRL